MEHLSRQHHLQLAAAAAAAARTSAAGLIHPVPSPAFLSHLHLQQHLHQRQEPAEGPLPLRVLSDETGGRPFVPSLPGGNNSIEILRLKGEQHAAAIAAAAANNPSPPPLAPSAAAMLKANVIPAAKEDSKGERAFDHIGLHLIRELIPHAGRQARIRENPFPAFVPAPRETH